MNPMNSNDKDQVARRAYEIWQSQGSPHGRDQEHWVVAERELSGPAGDGEAKPRRKARRASEGPSAARRTLKAKTKAAGRNAKAPKVKAPKVKAPKS